MDIITVTEDPEMLRLLKMQIKKTLALNKANSNPTPVCFDKQKRGSMRYKDTLN